MKKYLMVGLLFSLLLCTGCGKKLTCTGDMMGMDAKVVTKFSDDKAKSVSMEFTMDLKDLGYEDDEDVDMDEVVESVEEQFEDMDGYENVKVTSKGTTVTVKCDADVEDFGEATSYEDTKKQFEDLGLTCK